MTLKIIENKKFHSNDKNSHLIVFEIPQNFYLKRVFTISAKKKCIRGNHAHKKCTQIIQYLSGKVRLNIFNKKNEKSTFTLSTKKSLILIPPYNWLTIYMGDESKLNVLADKVYDRNEYIEDFVEFKKL